MKKLITLAAVTILVLNTGAQGLKPVAYKDGDQKLNGLVTANAGKKSPGVLILPAWKGIDDEAKNAAAELAKQGYIAFVADIYGEGNVPADNASAPPITIRRSESLDSLVPCMWQCPSAIMADPG